MKNKSGRKVKVLPGYTDWFEKDYEIIVMGTMAGGTGSGFLLDIAAILHDKLISENIEFKFSKYIAKCVGGIPINDLPGIYTVSFKDSRFLDSINASIKDIGPTINRKTIKRLLKNPDQLYKVPPQDFEKLVGEIYRGLGYNIEYTKKSHDGGVDIYLEKINDGMLHRYAVQCKHKIKKGAKIGVRIVREFLGALKDKYVTAGILFTNAFFTKEALKLIEKFSHKIFAFDLNGLLRLMRRYLVVTA